MKLHSCYIPFPLTRATEPVEERRDTVENTREQVEEGWEEPSRKCCHLALEF